MTAPQEKPRYFYRDPLAAAWMAKHFGMQFVFIRDDGWRQSVKSWKSIQRHERIYFIRNRSLHLLEPQEGDVVRDMIGACATVREESLAAIRRYFAGCASDSIIQRNGIPFMWPERESEAA